MTAAVHPFPPARRVHQVRKLAERMAKASAERSDQILLTEMRRIRIRLERVAAVRGKEVAKKSIISAAEFDIGKRRQRAYAEISAADQERLLVPQAKRIGQDTQFTNLDIVEAQTAIMQRLPKQLPRAAVAHAITEEVKNYTTSLDLKQPKGDAGKDTRKSSPASSAPTAPASAPAGGSPSTIMPLA